MEPRRLTERQRRFVDFYVETGNATEAAKRAGYKEKTARVTGQENLLKPAIKNAIAERMKEIKSESIAKSEEVLTFLTAAMRGELKEEVVTGEGIVQKTISNRDRLKAAELLMKRFGLTLSPLDVEEKKAHIEAMKKEADGSEDNEKVVIVDDINDNDQSL